MEEIERTKKTSQFTDEHVTISLERYEEMKKDIKKYKDDMFFYKEQNKQYENRFIHPLFDLLGTDEIASKIITNIVEKYDIKVDISELDMLDRSKTIVWSVKITMPEFLSISDEVEKCK